MVKEIQMEKWENGGGVNLRIKNLHDSEDKLLNMVSLDFADVDSLLVQLQEYQAHPSPFCGASCPAHGTNRCLKRTDFLENIVVAAVEGGIGYWADMKNYTFEEGKGDDHSMVSAECFVNVHGYMGWRILNIDTIRLGITKIKEPDFKINNMVLDDIIRGDRDSDAGQIDSTAADCIVQAGLFGKLIYG